GNERLIADIYTGRDPLGGAASLIIGEQGIPAHVIPDALATHSWRPPETTANLFLSRIRQIVANLTPGVPSFRTKARVPGAAHLSDAQNRLTRIMTDHGDLRAAMRRAAFIGLVSPYFGVKVTYDKSEKIPYNRIKYCAVEARDCGYEPFHRRFYWHGYDMQYGDLPEHWKPDFSGQEAPHPWEIVRVTECYHEGFAHGTKGKGCPMSIFVARNRHKDPSLTEINLTEDVENPVGTYVCTETLPECPLVIGNFLDPAPSEDVPAAEVLSWIPLMRMIVQTLVQIDREVRTSNNTILYDKNAIQDDAIQAVRNVVPGGTVFIGVDADDNTRGVNATMRPVEQSTVLNEYLGALQTYMRLFDDVTGVSPSDRGMATNPRKSATEAAAITDAASKRNADRLEIMAAMWTKIAQIGFKYQRQIFGKQVDIPLDNGVIRTIPVPDPAVACFSFDVDPVELGHLSNAGDIQALMQWLTVTTNAQQAFQGGIPRMTREALRRLGNAMGIEDADIFLDAPTIELGPEERYIRFLQTQEPIMVFEDDQHDMYVAYYAKMQEAAVNRNADEFEIMALRQALDMHRMYAARRQEVINPAAMGGIIPGVGAGPGEVDNNMLAALATGQTPQAMPQGGIGETTY
ncbi:MAG: hypothetical protein JSV86_08700, partial [Gemmatimonadota bacterium]